MEKRFIAGQQIWVDGKMAVYLFKSEDNIEYFIYGEKGQIANEKVHIMHSNQLVSTTSPVPAIKKGTPVLCWDNDNHENKLIMLYVRPLNDGHRASRRLGDERYIDYDNVVVYKLEE
tara:strand:+ start:61 stop:411 length:351 start_codon:yes stop_codon:yes gene_type:complete